ncbi:MAG TPA: hypothetical protein GX526_06340 [Thermoanaerobacterales bacterium]|nr:hypothetical protein [Thermoanaerobacterales bacterium]
MLKKISFRLINILYFFIGTFLTSLGIVTLVQSNIGPDPWSVLHVGISLHIPLTTGKINSIIGVSLLLLYLPMKAKPNIYTIINAYFVGFFIDFINKNSFVSPPLTTSWSFVYLILGILIFGVGTGIYGSFACSSRDNLIASLAILTKQKPKITKIIFEFIIVIIGTILGGPGSIGTLLFMGSVGHVINWARKNLKLPSFEVQPSSYNEEESL